MKKSELIAYAASFVSFALDRIKTPVKEIILFGSVARGDFDSGSDLDLFFNIPKQNQSLENELRIIKQKFFNSSIGESWKNKGITNTIAVKVGILNQWKLRGSIVSEGIILYGKYRNELKGEGYFLISFQPIKNVTIRNRVIREFYGRDKKQGIVQEFGGTKIAPTVLIIPIQFADNILLVLKKEKIDYTLREFWSDTYSR